MRDAVGGHADDGVRGDGVRGVLDGVVVRARVALGDAVGEAEGCGGGLVRRLVWGEERGDACQGERKEGGGRARTHILGCKR